MRNLGLMDPAFLGGLGGERDPYFANVSLLLHGNGTNGSTSIIDSSPSPKTVTAVGNAQISTAQSNFSGSSIAFDGNGDYLSTPTGSDFVFGAGDFTIEFWAWKSAAGSNNYDYVISSDPTIGTTSGEAKNGFAVELSAIRGLVFISNNLLLASYNFNPNDSQGRHYAVTRSANQLRLFTSGIVRASVTNTTNFLADHDIRIGSAANLAGTSAFWFNGYIDELRITKGVARYEVGTGANAGKMVHAGTNILALPTAPFPDA